MQNCYNKHGADYFSLSILYLGQEKDDILSKEQYYIDTLKPEFNTALIAGSTAGIKHSEKTVEHNRSVGRQKAVADEKGIRFSKSGKYEIYVRLKNNILNLGGFSTEEEAKLKQKEIRDYFWSDEFENKNLVDQDEEIALFKLQHKVKVKIERKTSGAVFESRINKYRARLYVEGRLINFGSFTLKEDAEKVYLEGRNLFVSQEFLLLSPEDKELFIKNFRESHIDKRNSNGHRYIRSKGNKYLFNYNGKYQRAFKTLEEAINHRDKFLASGCNLPSPKLNAESGYKHIYIFKNNKVRFSHTPTKHSATFSTLEEALQYRDEYFASGCSFETSKRTSNSGEKYIFATSSGSYSFRYKLTKHSKNFKTLEEAISYRNQYLENLKADAQ